MAAEGGAGGVVWDEAAESRVKVVVVGDGAVGKTSLLVSYIMDRFPTEHVPTVFANYAKETMLLGEHIHMWLCDTAGQEEYDRLRVMAYPDTGVFLVCFSIADPSSFHSVADKWYPEVHFHCPSAPCLLVSTKLDLRSSEMERSRLAKDGLQIVTQEQGQQLAERLGMQGYMECSALTQEGLSEVFEFAARLALSSDVTSRQRTQKSSSGFSFRRCRIL